MDLADVQVYTVGKRRMPRHASGRRRHPSTLARSGAACNRRLPPLWPLCAETNAAAFKPVTLSFSLNSNGTNSSAVGGLPPLQPLVDNNASSCVYLSAQNQSDHGMGGC